MRFYSLPIPIGLSDHREERSLPAHPKADGISRRALVDQTGHAPITFLGARARVLRGQGPRSGFILPTTRCYANHGSGSPSNQKEWIGSPSKNHSDIGLRKKMSEIAFGSSSPLRGWERDHQ